MRTSTSTIPAFITEAPTLLLNYSCCYSEVTAYTVLAYSYWASFHDTYGCLRHAH